MPVITRALIPLFLLAGEARAEFPDPVANYISRNDERSLQYATDRCGGLLLAALTLMSEKPQLADMLTEKLILLKAGSVLMMEAYSSSLEEARSKSASTMQSFSLEYIQGHINPSYIRTGNYLDDPIVALDLPACSSLADQWGS